MNWLQTSFLFISFMTGKNNLETILWDSDLEDFITTWWQPSGAGLNKSSDGSQRTPGEIALPLSGSSTSSLSTSTRGTHPKAVPSSKLLERDENKCVVSGKVKQGNWQCRGSAHYSCGITTTRCAAWGAGLRGLYDTAQQDAP
jgi:hypothetical protein